MKVSSKAIVRYLDKDKSWKEQDFGGVRPDKSICIVRYGGFGDVLQVSAVFKTFKEHGYYVCLNCTPKAYEVSKDNPYVDEFFIQDATQVVQEIDEDGYNTLSLYWHLLSQLFTRFINLSEHTEGSLLAIYGRPAHTWCKKARHMYMNHNYTEFLYAMCDLDWKKGNAIGEFYPTEEEDKTAKDFVATLKKNGAKKVILWSLSGTSPHKWTPWLDQVMARMFIKYPDTHFILADDYAGTILEQGWQDEDRVHKFSGKGIRETMSLIEHVDCVIGPETGVMNATASKNTATILLCSHSSKHNISKHWKNTITLEPKGLDCYPCHMLHTSRHFCTFDEDTGAAMCAYLIDSDMIEEAVIKSIYPKKKKIKRIAGM